MKAERDFWLQIEMAMKMQLIKKLDEVCFRTSKHKTHYGTRIHFSSTVKQYTINKLAEHLETTYQCNVQQDFPYSLTVWHKSGDTNHA